MIYSNALSFNVKWTYKTTGLLLLLIALPNLLGIVNIQTPWGFNIHFFQFAIFLTALIYGPKGGVLSGFVGSLYSAFIMHNPYIIIGNVILGFCFGLFARLKINNIIAVSLAYVIQLPWLILTDYYFIHLPVPFIKSLIIALTISNLLWAILANYAAVPIKRSLDIEE